MHVALHQLLGISRFVDGPLRHGIFISNRPDPSVRLPTVIPSVVTSPVDAYQFGPGTKDAGAGTGRGRVLLDSIDVPPPPGSRDRALP